MNEFERVRRKILISSAVIDVPQEGYWVHKDTGVKTYFDLEDSSIVDGVMSTPSWAFDCSEVNIPEGVTSLGEYCFYECYALTSITLPESLTSLGGMCFYNCLSLTSITIPEGLTSIEWQTFSHCYSLTSITIPEGVTSIGEQAFYECTSLSLVTSLPTVPPTLGSYGFYDTHANLIIKVPAQSVNAYKTATNWINYASIISAIPEPGYWVHKDTGVKTYFGLDADFITDGIMSAPSWRFDCSEVNIPEGVISLGAMCFYNCPSLASINIPEGVTGLGTNCFRGCTSLTSITLPESVTSLGDYTFYGCTYLASINIPEGVTSLSNQCFRGCSALTSINIPEGVTNLGDGCFRGCSALTSINIPEGVTNLGSLCFYDCSFLTLATVLPATPPTLGVTAFVNVHISFIIKVRSPYVNAYKAATNWVEYASKISAI